MIDRLKVFSAPLAWLLIQGTVMAFMIALPGYFDLKLTRDSESFLIFFPTWEGFYSFLQDILTNYRTFGYPLFLKIINFIMPGLDSLPLAHYLFHLAAVLIFWMSLRRYGFGPWTAFSAASPLLYARIVLKYCPQVMSDTVGISAVIITYSFLFLVSSLPQRVFYWLGLLISLFMTYQIRPVYVFLVFLIPFQGFILFLLHGNNRIKKGQMALRYLAVSCIPFLLFCALRWAMVGEFGFASYAGVNASGPATWLLKPDIIPKLPENLQVLAESILKKRRDLGAPDGIEGDRVHWRDHNTWLYANPRYINQVAMPTAAEIYGSNKRNYGGITLNRNLEKLSLELIKLRPHIYFQLVFLSIQKFMMETINTNLLLQAALLFFILSRIFVAASNAPGPIPEATIMLFIGATFFLSKMIGVTLVQMPVGRYYMAAEIFLPSIFLTAAFAPWKRKLPDIT